MINSCHQRDEQEIYHILVDPAMVLDEQLMKLLGVSDAVIHRRGFPLGQVPSGIVQLGLRMQ